MKLENNICRLNPEIKNILSNELNSVISYVYKYDDDFLNETIFKNFLWLNLENYNSPEDFINDSFKKIEEKIKNIYIIKEKISSGNINIWKAKNYFLINIENVIIFLENLKIISKIETQKIKKFNYKIEENELKILLEKLKKFEEKIFWDELHKNKYYSNEIILEIEDLLEKNKEKLEKKDIFFIENIIKELREKTYTKDFKEKNNSKINLNEPLKNSDNKILENKIKRKDYIEIFKLAIEIIWIKLKVVIDNKVWNISVSENWYLKIPAKNEYKELKIKEILDLISHEIETHWIIMTNNENLFCWIRSVWYQIKEEWTASLFWKISSWKVLEENWLSISDILVWEVFNWKTLKKFLEIRKKINPESKMTVNKRFERLKRWRDFELAWVNPKEKAYFVWKKEVIKKINQEISFSKNKYSQNNILNLFIWKNSFETEQELTRILEIDKSFSIEKIREKWIILPLMIWEILKYKLLTKSEKNDWLLGWFLKYFNDKYWPIFNNLWINYKDFVKNYIWVEKEENKKRIKEILEILIK